jgi:hypothetical protein
MQETLVDLLRHLLKERDKVNDQIEGEEIRIAALLSVCIQSAASSGGALSQEDLIGFLTGRLESYGSLTQERHHDGLIELQGDLQSDFLYEHVRSSLMGLILKLNSINQKISWCRVCMHLEAPPGLPDLIQHLDDDTKTRTRAKRRQERDELPGQSHLFDSEKG